MKENSGETAGLPWLETLLNDVRFGARMLRKNPAFTLVAALTLALGIGANTAIFTVINAVFLHPIPVENPQRMVSLFTTDQRNRGQLTNFLPVSYPNGLDIQKQAQSFSGVALVSGTGVSMTVDGQADRYGAAVVSGNYFDVLGVRAALGRTFLPQEDSQPGAGPVIVISHGLWERKFGNDRNVIGKTVLLNGQGFTVIGVAPVGFQGTAVLGGPDMWVPMSMHDQIFAGLQKQFFNERRFLGFFPVARLKDGASPERARQELQAIGSTLEREYPIPNKGRSFTVVPLLESTINPNARASFTFAGAMMMGVVGFVLLIACVNIASLLMVRATARKREIAIRAAMGASRARVVSQLLTEAVLLALGGGIIGLGLAVLGRNLLWKFRPPFLLQTNLDLSLDGRVLLFTLGVTLATGLIFGVIPALQASRPDLVSELKERTGDGAVTTWRRLLRHGFVVGQVALSLIPLVGAGLFLLSLRNAQSIDPGFDTHNLAIITFNVGSLNYDPPRVKEFQRRVLETTLAVPGVKSATLAAVVPLFGGGFGRSVFPEGAEGSTDRNGVLVTIDSVSSDYLETMGIPLLRGRGFDSSVREDSPHVVIINETAARRFWPNENAVDKRFKFFGDTEWTQVIGVARDSKYNTLGEDPLPYVYQPVIQAPSPAVTLFVRSNTDPAAILSTVRERVQALDRNLPLTNVFPFGEVISQALWNARFGAALIGIFASLALLLCSVGIYGVVGYSVGQRVREIGVRMALGAQRGDVLRMVLRQSAITIGVGLALGLVFSFVLARLAAQQLGGVLYGISASTPYAFVGMALVLALVGLLASYIPARRAASVDPLAALRNE